jgi:phosphoribosylanthranilate isomerase
MTKIKICGLTNIEDAIAATKDGADFIGLIFAPSRRQVSTEKAAWIVAEVKKLDRPPQVVGVFVNLEAGDVNRIAAYCCLDWVQLSGDESWCYCLDIAYPIIKTIHITPQKNKEQIIEEIEKGYSMNLKKQLLCLLDTKYGDTYGGSGRVFDWQLLNDITQKYQVMVAGGLSPKNVGQLIQRAKPWGVDVSSGVESIGEKSWRRIKAFIKVVRLAEKEVGNATG